MCDTVVVVPELGPVWFAKNSDREPSEAQFVECDDGSSGHAPPPGLPSVRPASRVLLSRPGWMWGAEIGVNEHGVAIGNEAVFTRFPAPKEGASGMDFLRIALSHCRNANDALDQLIDLTERFLPSELRRNTQRPGALAGSPESRSNGNHSANSASYTIRLSIRV